MPSGHLIVVCELRKRLKNTCPNVYKIMFAPLEMTHN